MSIILRVIGWFGVLLFGCFFLLTFLSPEAIEKSAKDFVIFQIEKEVSEKYEAASQATVADRALDIADRLGYEKDKIQKNLEDNLPEKIASIVAAMCGYDCEKKKQLSQSLTANYLDRIKNIEVAQDTLGNIIKGKYLEIVSNLKFDLRIFLGSNLVLFLLLIIVSFLKPQAIAHLFFPGMLLLLTTVISSSIYIFGQDWFYTILYNDYMEFAYLAYVAAIFGILMDIALNKARVTAEIINGIAQVIGSAFSVTPC